MTPDKRLPPLFKNARRGTAFAAIEWTVADLRQIRPSWSEAQAAAFLKKVERQLVEATLAAGCYTLMRLLSETRGDA
jgi:hypothetical protein